MSKLLKTAAVFLCAVIVASTLSFCASAQVQLIGNYPDVPENEWYYDAVSYCSEEGFITGYGNGRFGPLDRIQRQDFVVILARIADVNLNKYKPSAAISRFSDVSDPNAYYVRALTWGISTGVIQGYANGSFGVGDAVTREQVCVFLYRYLDYMGKDTVVTASMITGLMNFKDAASISSFAQKSVAWCRHNGIVGGTANGYFNPTRYALRCEVAQIIMNAAKNGFFGKWIDI